MAITEAYSGSASISTTEYSLTNNSTTLGSVTDDGCYQIWLDLNALTITEGYVLKIYEKVRSASTQRVASEFYIYGAQALPNFATPSMILLHGWEVTLDKITGTDRTIEWSIRKVA
jgi:hypothetical protein